MHAIILAAGEGIRLRPLTTYMPKVMLPVGNKPILEYVIEALRENDVKDITIVVGYHSDKIKQYFGNGADFRVNIRYVTQNKQIGTAHALYQARSDGEFLLVYGDNMIDPKCVKEIMDTEINTILGTYSNKPFRYGVVERDNENFVEIREKPHRNEGAIVFTGLGHFDGKIFEVIEERIKEDMYNLPDILNMMDIRVKISKCGWRDAIYPWDLLDLNSYILSSNIRKLAGKIEDSVIIGNVEIGENAKIGAGTYIKGNVKIGDNCEIGPNSVIIGDTSIGEGVRIGAFGYVENSILMSNTSVGIGSIIRDSVIGRGVSIGDKFIVISKRVTRILWNEMMEIEGGVIIGDGAKIGSLVVAHPGVIVGGDSSIRDLKIIYEDVNNGESVR